MKNYALLDDNNVVLNISIANDNWDSSGWIEYFDSNPAIIGGDYVDGYFYAIQPYPSWTRYEGTWVSPVPYPDVYGFYIWNEQTQSWDSSETPFK